MDNEKLVAIEKDEKGDLVIAFKDPTVACYFAEWVCMKADIQSKDQIEIMCGKICACLGMLATKEIEIRSNRS